MKWYLVLIMKVLAFSSSAQIKPADGLWSTTDDPAIGSGLMMTTQNGVSVISVFTYDEIGQNVWYISSGMVNEEGVFESELIESENGQNMLVDNPQSASFVEQRKNIKIVFQGSQLATMQIGGSEPKFIQPNHFGFASDFGYPDISGQWVIANKVSGTSILLDLELSGSANITGFVNFFYNSQHSNTQDWNVYCSLRQSTPFHTGGCAFDPDENSSHPEIFINFVDLGNKKFVAMNNNEGDYQAFRLDQDSKLLPNDGLWRPADDPAIGSGMAMRTQGDFTVVLLYTYDDEGHAVWQNAAGQFDENGKMVAELYTPNNGTAIESNTPSSAEFEGEPQSLVIQLEGTELATFSINGSVPKYIQNLNFASELFETQIFEPLNKPYVFPAQLGKWVWVDPQGANSFVWNLFTVHPNSCVSPPNPIYSDSVTFANIPICTDPPEPIFEDPNFMVLINCVKSFKDFPNDEHPDIDYCYGENYLQDSELIKINFSDLGHNRFRFYTGPRNQESYFESLDQINRDSPMYQLYRLQ